MARFQQFISSLLIVLLAICSGNEDFGPQPLHVMGPALSHNVPLQTAGLGCGVNFGNMLEAPNEGDWGLFVEEIFFDKVVEAGIDHIRIPVSWTHHADPFPPYTIEPDFIDRVEWVIDQALSRKLKVILNNHHYDELNDDPQAEWNRALGIWQQIAERFQFESTEELYFEILNEPHGEFNSTPSLWNQFMADALAVIRQTNPSRKVLVGPVFWNSLRGLDSFVPPEDQNLVGAFHFYEPFEFTHQGAEWIDPPPLIGTPWDGEIYGLAALFQNWSWSTTIEPSVEGLNISYDAGYAGFQVHSTTPIENGQELTFTVDQAMDLMIAVTNNTTGQQHQVSLQTGSGAQTYTVDISSFGDINSITNIFIQNATGDPVPPYLLSLFSLRTDSGHIRLIANELTNLVSSFRQMSTWSVQTGIPVHLGEFGAYQFADIDSRVQWTTAVRRTAESFGIDWAYWELAAGFGFYDPDNDEWRLPLLQALIPGFEE